MLMRNVLRPVIGEGVTEQWYSDAKAHTIIAISSNGRKITIQRDKAKLMNAANSGEPDALKFYAGGFCGHTEGRQRYEYEADPAGAIAVYTFRKNGRWVKAGAAMHNGTYLTAGRSEFYDFNF